MRSLHFPLKLALPAAIAVIATGAVAVAAIPGADGTIDACFANSGPNKGSVRLVSDGVNCKNNETAISWNQRGQKGDTGATGAAGAKGDQGATGPKGDTGLAGANGQNGVNGADGTQGVTGPQGLTGPKGDTGAVGPQGPQGATGPQGPAGANGTEALTLGGEAVSDGRADAYVHLEPYSASTPNADGDITIDKTAGFFQVKSFDYSLENTVSIGSSSSGAGAGKASFGDLHITKLVDKSSAGIIKSLAVGAHYKRAVVVFRTREAKPRTFMTVTFGVVVPKKYEQGGKAEPPLLENIDFAYGQVFSSWQPFNPDGSLGTKSESGWDVMSNKAVTDPATMGTVPGA